MGLQTEILGLSIGYALLGLLLLLALTRTRLPWPVKAGAVVLTSAFYVLVYFRTAGLLGWSAPEPLPARFQLLWARSVEPNKALGEPGAVHLWVEELDADNFPSGVPRAYRRPYSTALARKVESARTEIGNGRPQGGRRPEIFSRPTAAALYNRRAPGAESNKNVRSGGWTRMQHGSGLFPHAGRRARAGNQADLNRRRSFMRKLCLAMAMAGMLASGLAQAQSTLRIGLQDDPDVLDPVRARTFVGRIVFASLCDKLVEITPDLKIVPQLAQSWTISPDHKVLTFKLRTDAVFHDGTPVDAAAVKANLDRARTLPDSNRKSELATVASVEAPDASTVVLNLSEPDASLLSQLSDRAGMMMSPASFDKDPGGKPVCSGPYQFKERVQNDRIVLEKFPKYWDAANYHFDRLVYTPIPDNTVRLNNLRAGDLDIIERVAPSDAKAVKDDKNLTLAPVTGLGFQAISVNLANGARANNPLAKDKRVRQALDLAIDRDVLNQVIGEGMFQPAYQPFPPASFAYNTAFEHKGRDPKKAQALLKEAGFDRVKFEITFGNNTTMQQVFELVQAMGAEAGFDITLRPVEFASLQSSLARGDFEVGQSGWSGRVDPSGNIHQYLSCKGNLNDGKFCDAGVDKLLNDARAESDTAKRRAMYDQVLATMQDQRPIVYLFYLPWTFGVQKKLEGFVPYPDGLIRLKGVTVAKK